MTNAHKRNHIAEQYPPQWTDARPPNITAGKTTGRLRSCSFCGSMHPTDLVAALTVGAKASWADFKYGWPHKLYVDGIPNPHAGLTESRESCSYPKEPTDEERKRYQHWRQESSRWLGWNEAPAAATTYGKFYTEHLQDATEEERAVIERAMGMHFTFSDNGAVAWEPVQRTTAPDSREGA
jgi:hypothetical protein